MTKTSKSLLIVSIICLVTGTAFTTGLINVENAVIFYVTLPTGAILFGLFLISKMLEKEVAAYDRDHREIQPATSESAGTAKSQADCGCGCGAHETPAKP